MSEDQAAVTGGRPAGEWSIWSGRDVLPDLVRSSRCRPVPSGHGWRTGRPRGRRAGTGSAPKSSKIPIPVRSWPRWSRGIPTRIAHGIGHGLARVFRACSWIPLATRRLT